MKKLISLLLLLSLLTPSFSAEFSASSLGEEILQDLLDMNLEIERLQRSLESLERNSTEREQLLESLERSATERELLLKSLEENRAKRVLVRDAVDACGRAGEGVQGVVKKVEILNGLVRELERRAGGGGDLPGGE